MDPGARLKQLADMATLKAKVNHNTAPKMYLRSAILLEQQARSYYEDEDWVSSYVLSVRFCHLVLQELPAHPKYKEVPKVEKDRARKKVKVMLERAEELKKKLNAMFMAEYEEKKKEELQQKKEEEKRLEEEQRRQYKLKEEQRLLEEQHKKAKEERQKLEQKQRDEIAAAAAVVATTHNIPVEVSSSITPLQTDGHHPQQPSIAQPPPKDHVIIHGGVSPVVDRSNKPAYLMQQEPYHQTQPQPYPQTQPNSQDIQPQPIVDRSTKPSSHHPAISDVFLSGIETLQATGGLRMVQVSQNIAQDFLNAASSNTRRNVETGGFLAGKLSRNVFKITHLIIPQQEGNSDNFVTRNEEEYFEEMEKHDLIQLGWIHTHPSQTSFLSSIDLHLQLYHQGMLEEAVAIVVAPKYSQVGYYHLTAHGLDVIGNCQQTGFHPHPKHPPLFEDCKHVQHEPATSVAVVDLRRR